MADSAGNSAGIGRKLIFLDSLAPRDPFCTFKHFHNSFCGDFEPIQKLVVRAYMENYGNFLFFVKIVFFATHATILHWDCSHALTLSGEVTFSIMDTSESLLDPRGPGMNSCEVHFEMCHVDVIFSKKSKNFVAKCNICCQGARQVLLIFCH